MEATNTPQDTTLNRREGESDDEYRSRVVAYINEHMPADPGEPMLIVLVRAKAVEGEKESAQRARMETIKAAVMAHPEVIDAAMTYGTPQNPRQHDIFARSTMQRALSFLRTGWPASPKVVKALMARNE